MPLAAWSKSSGAGEPWTSFETARRLLASGRTEEGRAVLHGVIATPELESRHYLEAWLALRELGATPPVGIAKQVLGVVVEAALKDGLDLVAAYRDRSARYYNYSGAAVVWERPDESLDSLVTSLLTAGQKVADEIGPWEGPRPPAPPVGEVRINMLTPSGLLFGQAEFAALAADPLGGQVLATATALTQALIAKTVSSRPSDRDRPSQAPGMDKGRRKALKAQAKHLLAAEGTRRKDALAESIPVDMSDPDWGFYYRENTLRERRIRSNRSRVLSGARVGLDLLWFSLRPTPDDRDLADVDYFRCLSCSDLIPLAPRRRLRCSCGSLTHGPLALGAPVDTPQSAEMVRVLAKAPPRKWWHAWRRLGFVWL